MNIKIVKKMLSVSFLVMIMVSIIPMAFAKAEVINQDNKNVVVVGNLKYDRDMYTVECAMEDLSVDCKSGVSFIELYYSYFDGIRSGTKLVISVKSSDDANPSKLAMYRAEDSDKTEPIYVRLFDQETYEAAVEAANGDLAVAHTKLLKSHDSTIAAKKEYLYDFENDLAQIENEENKNVAKTFKFYAVLDFLDDGYILRPTGEYRGKLTAVCTVEWLGETEK